MIQLKDIAPAAANNINTKFILLEKGVTKNMSNCLVADETAAVNFQLWGGECEAFQPGDIIRLTNGIFSYNQNRELVLRAGKRGRIEKVGQFTLAYVETPNMSHEWVADPNNPYKFLKPRDVSPHPHSLPPHH